MTPRAVAAAATAVEAALIGTLLAATAPLGPLTAPPDSYAGAFLTPPDLEHSFLLPLRWLAWLLLAALLAGAWLSVLRPQLGRQAAKLPKLSGLPEDGAPEPRFDAHQRLQHIVVLSSVAVLALTGLPQAFPAAPGAEAALAFWGGAAAARTVHRIAAASSDFAVAYHLVYLLLLAWRRGLPTALLPGRRGLPTALLPGRRGGRSRFTAGQKADYWTVAALLPLQTATGLALVHADLTVAAAPPWMLAAALAVHRTAAAALVGYILVAHLYHGVLDRAVFPLNTAIFTGSLRRRSHLALFAGEAPPGAPAPNVRRPARRSPTAARERT